MAAVRIPRDNVILFPFGTFHDLHPEITDLTLIVKYDSPQNKSLVEEEIRDLLRIRRKVRVEKPDDFEISGPDSLTRLWGQLSGGLFLFMFAVSSVGLMVGGVGVMNIMLVSVTERTREIGVRKALGATRRTILTQFTTEAVTLCAVGGLIGLLVGSYPYLDRLFSPHWHSRHALSSLGRRRLHGVLRHWARLRHLSGLEGGDARPHRSSALRVTESCLLLALS